MGKVKKDRTLHTWKDLLAQLGLPGALLALTLAALVLILFNPNPVLDVFGQELPIPLHASGAANYAADGLHLEVAFDSAGLIESALSAALGSNEPLPDLAAAPIGGLTGTPGGELPVNPTAAATRTPTQRSTPTQPLAPTVTRTWRPTAEPLLPTQPPARPTVPATHPPARTPGLPTQAPTQPPVNPTAPPATQPGYPAPIPATTTPVPYP